MNINEKMNITVLNDCRVTANGEFIFTIHFSNFTFSQERFFNLENRTLYKAESAEKGDEISLSDLQTKKILNRIRLLNDENEIYFYEQKSGLQFWAALARGIWPMKINRQSDYESMKNFSRERFNSALTENS